MLHHITVSLALSSPLWYKSEGKNRQFAGQDKGESGRESFQRGSVGESRPGFTRDLSPEKRKAPGRGRRQVIQLPVRKKHNTRRKKSERPREGILSKVRGFFNSPFPSKSELRRLNTELWFKDAEVLMPQIKKSSPKPQAARNQPSAIDPDIAKRRAIVKQNPSLRADGICQLFDFHGIPLPKSMKEAKGWASAYRTKQHRHAIESLIARDRKKA